MCRRSQCLEMIVGGPALAACLLALSLLRRVPGGCPGACHAAAAAAAAACKALTVLYLFLFPLSFTSLSLAVPGARRRSGRALPRLRERPLRRQVHILPGLSLVARDHHGLAFNDAENWKTGAPRELVGAPRELFGCSGGGFRSSRGRFWKHFGMILEPFFCPWLDL